MKGPDHKASLEPKDLIDLIKVVNNAKKILGKFIKKPTKNELKNIKYARKSIVASEPIKKEYLLKTISPPKDPYWAYRLLTGKNILEKKQKKILITMSL